MNLPPLLVIALTATAFAADPPKAINGPPPVSTATEPASGVSRKVEINFEGRIVEYGFSLSGERLLITRHEPRTWDGKGNEAQWRAAEEERTRKEPSLQVDMKDIQKVGAFFIKFSEWEIHARERDVAPFSKVLGKAGDHEFTFHWSVMPPGSKFAYLTPSHFNGDDVAHVLALLRNELPSAKKEMDELRAAQPK